MTTIEEIKGTVEDMHDRASKWMDTQAKTIKGLESRLDEFEAKGNVLRLGQGGGGGGGGGDAEYFKAVANFARTGDDLQLKTMHVGSDPDGGYLVMPERARTMIAKLWDQSPMRRLCRVEMMSTGDAWEEPVDNDESEATWVGERTARTAGATPNLGMLRVQVHETYALQPITQKLLDDSYVNLGQWLEGKIIDKFGRQEGTAFATGDGVAKPKGFLSYATDTAADSTRAWGTIQHKVSGSAAAVTADALRNLVWALRTPYRAGAAWQMNSNTAGAVDTLKDSTGQYLWRPSSQAGQPDTLLGYPVELNEDMADVGANAFPIAFGNWKRAYLIVDKVGLRFLQDPYSDKPNVQFYAYRRVGGGLANSEAIKLMKCST